MENGLGMKMSEGDSESVGVYDNNTKAIHLLTDILTNDEVEDKFKIQTLAVLRNLFSNGISLESKIFQHIQLDAFLGTVVAFQDDTLKNTLHDDFLLDYGNSILAVLELNSEINEILIKQLEWIFRQLRKKQSKNMEMFVKNVWIVLENRTIMCVDFLNEILETSKSHIEGIVFTWVKDLVQTVVIPGNLDMSYFIRTSCSLPKLFQCITSILNQILVKLNGYHKVMELISFYVESVFKMCQDTQKNFYKLYPRGDSSLLMLLTLPPQYLPSCTSLYTINKEYVLCNLSSKYTTNPKRVLMLLTHFPAWISYFGDYTDMLEKT